MRCTSIVRDPSEAVRIDGVLELPEGVTGQVSADKESSPPRKFEGLPSEPELFDDAGSRRHKLREEECEGECIFRWGLEMFWL